jgi:hypothetical protein
MSAAYQSLIQRFDMQERFILKDHQISHGLRFSVEESGSLPLTGRREHVFCRSVGWVPYLRKRQVASAPG